VDELNTQIPTVKTSDAKYLAKLSDKRERTTVVETKHPYPQNKQAVKETITFPGAQALTIFFDEHSRTYSSSSDILQLFNSPTLEQAILHNGVPAYFSGSNFPRQPINVQGDTITFVFTAGSRFDPKMATNDKLVQQRWGFRCIIKEIILGSSYQAPISHWSLYLESTLAYVSGRCASSLVEGESVSALEKSYSEWLQSSIVCGGLEDATKTSETTQWLQQFLDNTDSEANQLHKWIKQQNKGPILQPSAAKFVDQVERYTVAAMLKHVDLLKEAVEATKLLSNKQPLPGDVQAKFKLLGKKASSVSSWVLRRGQTEKAWQIAVSEGNSDISFFDSYKQNPQSLGELCEMKNVGFDLMDTDETIKLLHNQLKADIEAAKLSSADGAITNPYELIAKPVIERLRFLIRTVPNVASLHHPAANAINPFSVSKSGSSLELTTSQPDITDFNSSHNPLLSRSMSELPSTSTAAEIQKRKARDAQHDMAFNQRVGELRKWLHAYDNWKGWQESSLLARGLKEHVIPPSSPVQAVSSFATATSISPKELEKLIGTQTTRANSRRKDFTTSTMFYKNLRLVPCVIKYYSPLELLSLVAATTLKIFRLVVTIFR
jgi:hypothetical protein